MAQATDEPPTETLRQIDQTSPNGVWVVDPTEPTGWKFIGNSALDRMSARDLAEYLTGEKDV